MINWIPVAQRLPEPYADIFVTDRRVIERALLNGDNEFVAYDLKRVIPFNFITHWAEINLPESES